MSYRSAQRGAWQEPAAKTPESTFDPGSDGSATPEAEFAPVGFIETFSDGTFQLSEGGHWAKLLPVRNRFDEVIDVIAWQAGKPFQWWLRHGVATVLGDDELSRAWWLDAPVLLVDTPEDWLRARGRAVCFLTWAIDPRDVLAPCREVICATSALCRRLEARIAELSRPAFRIRVAPVQKQRTDRPPRLGVHAALPIRPLTTCK